MAGELVRIAAQRLTRAAPRLTAPRASTTNSARASPMTKRRIRRSAIEATLDDLAAGRPMDRLICGDVGFGKTEVALRAAFAAAINGKQTAIVVPTTLLARQHFQEFHAALRRPAGAHRPALAHGRRRRAARGEEGPRRGRARHRRRHPRRARQDREFKDLGLVVIDEEQHFGVGHKERLKELRAEVHVLTLSATPIPRTLQLAMTGVRDLSIIATPPVDRLAVRTFVSPFDRADRARGAAARALSRRPVVLCLPAHRGPRRMRGVPAPERARGKFVIAHGQLAMRRARGQDRRLLRRQIRHPACRPRSSNPASTFRAPTR
jgi:transcription-repair coupling factor (superfamily II helicase)